MRVLLLLMALPACNAGTKHMKTGLTFGKDCPTTFLMKDSQADNKIPGFSAGGALTDQP